MHSCARPGCDDEALRPGGPARRTWQAPCLAPRPPSRPPADPRSLPTHVIQCKGGSRTAAGRPVALPPRPPVHCTIRQVPRRPPHRCLREGLSPWLLQPFRHGTALRVVPGEGRTTKLRAAERVGTMQRRASTYADTRGHGFSAPEGSAACPNSRRNGVSHKALTPVRVPVASPSPLPVHAHLTRLPKPHPRPHSPAGNNACRGMHGGGPPQRRLRHVATSRLAA